MQYTAHDLEKMNRVKRLNIINAVSGIKPANLIGTKANNGQTNLAIFSSVVHLGSNPPYLGFILRPEGEVPRHTFENILENKFYTINHIQQDFIKKAHYTSAKFDREISEFEKCHLTEEYIADFHAPFVMESKLKLGLEFVQQIPIELNGTSMVIGKIVLAVIPDAALEESGRINLDAIQDVGIGGLNSYYSLNKLDEFPYVRLEEFPDLG